MSLPEFKAKPNLIARTLGIDAVLLDTDAGTYFALNNTALFIWERLATNTAPQEIVAQMITAWGLTVERAEADYCDIIQSFREAGLSAA
jgi:Coenzyme PQQ synthesis protein D (PqqD)